MTDEMGPATALAWQVAGAHQEGVDGAGALAAFADGPDHQRLAAAHVAAGEDLGRGGAVVDHIGLHIATRVEFDPGAGSKAPAYSGRVVKILDKMRARTFAVYRSAADGSGRAAPVEKRAAGREYVIPAGMAGEARDGDLVAIEPLREGRLGLPPARVVETIGSVKSERAVSLIALEMHHIPHVFSPATLKEAEDARPVRLSPPREDWRTLPLVTIDPPDARDHDDAVHAELDPDPGNSGGFIVTVAIAMLPRKLPSPEYVAVSTSALAGSNAVWNVAIPPATGLVPTSVLPSVNVTVPVALIPSTADGATVAVNTTPCP